MSNIVKYAEFSIEAANAIDQRVDDIGGSIYFDPVIGDNVLRFLPGSPGSQPFRVTAQHYIDALPGLDRMIVFACPRVELKQPCLACSKAEELMRTGNPLDREAARRMGASVRVFSNVVNRANPDAGPRVYGFGKMVWDQLKVIRSNARLGGDFTIPTAAGFDIILNKEGDGRKTKYGVSADRNNSPLAPTEQEIDAILLATHNLDALVDPVPPEELFAAWGQSMRGQVSAAAAIASKQPAGRLSAPCARVIDATVTQAEPVGAKFARGKAAPAVGSAVKDAEDTSWLDE